MQPESSMDPGQISIQKLNEARETGWAEIGRRNGIENQT